MHISKVVIKNYRCLEDTTLELNNDLNIVVGNNECGKSTLLEAINLALSFQLNGRPIQSELHPHLFNGNAVRTYMAARAAGQNPLSPCILIEVYFGDDPAFARLQGKNNSLNQDAVGVCLSIEFDEDHKVSFADYFRDVTNGAVIRTLPVEYYKARLRGFDGNDVAPRAIPFKPSFIDASQIRNTNIAGRYVVDLLKDSLTNRELVDLALSYRMMKDKFLDDEKVGAINVALAGKKGRISNKTLSVSLDTSSRANWETGIMPHLDDIPMPLVGKGEQNSVKIKLALESSGDSHLVMIEEPENHLSYANLNRLIGDIADKRGTRQLILTTHSSFVMNKLGVGSVVLFAGRKGLRLNSLTKPTRDYFVKLPGHDTLRLILCARAILVEGPSDELIVQKAYQMKHGRPPIQDGVDVITVSSLAFKRFLEIADKLGRRVDVVTDNDKDVAALKEKYKDYLNHATIRIQFDGNEARPTLEPQLVESNGWQEVKKILGRPEADEASLIDYMTKNKTDCALKFLEADAWIIPPYIDRAITQ